MFSIIIPAYNEEKYISKCLKSVAGLEGTVDYETIVVNNASTDRTCQVVRKVLHQANLIDEPKKGLTRAYNRGAKEAQGEILVFVDADMILPPNHLERIAKEFDKDKELVALSGPYMYKDNGKLCELLFRFTYLFLAMPAELFFNRFLNFAASLASGNSAIQRQAFEKVGGFNENIFYGLEPDMALGLKKVGKVRFKHYLSVESSARRLKKEGMFRMLFRHSLNTVWLSFFGQPFTKDYIDVR